MKISKVIFLVFFLTASTTFNVFAGVKPAAEMPPPTAKNSSGVNSVSSIDPDPELPIDQNLEILLLSGLLLGAVFIYKDKIKKSFS